MSISILENKYKSTADLINSVVNSHQKDNTPSEDLYPVPSFEPQTLSSEEEEELSEEQESLNKILALDGTFTDQVQQWYIDRIKDSKYTFFATGDSNWDFYMDSDSYIYAIAKVPGCSSSTYGDINHYNRCKKKTNTL